MAGRVNVELTLSDRAYTVVAGRSGFFVAERGSFVSEGLRETRASQSLREEAQASLRRHIIREVGFGADRNLPEPFLLTKQEAGSLRQALESKQRQNRLRRRA